MTKAGSKGLPRAYRYRISPEANAGKIARLEDVAAEWKRTLPLAFAWYWTPFLNGGLFPWKPARSGAASTFPRTLLVTSQKDLMGLAIEAQAAGWASNLVRRLKISLMRDQMLVKDPNLRRELLWINSMKCWLLPYRQQLALLAAQPAKDGKLVQISTFASRTMLRIVRRYIELHRLPDPMGLPLQVNQLSATMGGASKSRSTWAPRWLRVSTLERGKKMSLPIMGNPYADSRSGPMASTFSLVQREGGWEVIATKYVQPTPWAEHKVDALEIDLGLKNLMATSEGDLRGVGFIDRLRRYDDQFLKITRGLQGAGHVRLSGCRRYRLFVDRLRGFLKTTIQTALAQILDLRRPKKVIIEDLLFAGQKGELSKRMNRLLRRFGQRYFTQTLEERKAEYGFELEIVDPAYSSQQCRSCLFTHRGNRQGNNFKCLSCGHQAHADIHAAKNLTGRSSQDAAINESSRHPGGRRTRWMQALHQWMGATRQSIGQASPGSSRHARAVGCARAGLRVLVDRKQSASRLPASVLNQLRAAADSTSLPGLLNGLSVNVVQQDRTLVSTRKSG